MGRVDLLLSELTLAQKLHLMEAIWDDLVKNEQTLESPLWHEEVLRDREEALAAGKGIVSEWKEANDRISKERLVRVKILDAAERDLEQGYRFYERQARAACQL
jgi:hypothetical protein